MIHNDENLRKSGVEIKYDLFGTTHLEKLHNTYFDRYIRCIF